MKNKKTIASLLAGFMMTLTLSLNVFAAGDASFAIGSVSGKPGDTVNVQITVASGTDLNSIALYQLTYDENVLTFEGFDNYGTIEDQCFLAGFDDDMGVITLALAETAPLNGDICTLRFTIKGNASAGTTDIGMTSLVKNNSEVISSTVSDGSVTVEKETAVHTHIMSYFPEKAATCRASGQLEHWNCASCGKNFADEAGRNEMPYVTVPVDADNHAGGTEVSGAKEASAGKTGYTGDTVCLGCGKVVEKGSVIPALPGTAETEKPSAETNKPSAETNKPSAETNKPSAETDRPAAETNKTDKEPDVTVGDDKPVAPATPTTPWTNPFADVSANASYYDAIRFVYENGLFKGVSDTKFEPDTTMTRAMFVTVLGRLEGVDTRYFSEGCSFDDVVEGEWYHAYVEWASSKGIVNGYGDGKFGVDDEITIEQAAVILARYAAYAGKYKVVNTALTKYGDGDLVSHWAKSEMQWAVEKGIYTGTASKLNPGAPASRALVATMLYSYVNAFGK